MRPGLQPDGSVLPLAVLQPRRGPALRVREAESFRFPKGRFPINGQDAVGSESLNPILLVTKVKTVVAVRRDGKFPFNPLGGEFQFRPMTFIRIFATS